MLLQLTDIHTSYWQQPVVLRAAMSHKNPASLFSPSEMNVILHNLLTTQFSFRTAVYACCAVMAPFGSPHFELYSGHSVLSLFYTHVNVGWWSHVPSGAIFTLLWLTTNSVLRVLWEIRYFILHGYVTVLQFSEFSLSLCLVPADCGFLYLYHLPTHTHTHTHTYTDFTK